MSQIGGLSLRLNKVRAFRSIMSNGSWSGLERVGMCGRCLEELEELIIA